MGNILVGGLVGTAIDLNDGAAYGYPQTVSVPLQLAAASAGTPSASPNATVPVGPPVAAANMPPASTTPLN
ncbi:MAG TPA: hypothetical protein PK231_08535 [Acidocella sp.]|nr:hypothetical protein [Acidocella sp.]